MKDSVLTTKGWALLIVAAVLVAAGTINFAMRLTHTGPPTDGIDWVTQDMVIQILHDEEGHRRLFEGYLREYEVEGLA